MGNNQSFIKDISYIIPNSEDLDKGLVFFAIY